MTTATSRRESIPSALVGSYIGLVHHHHDRKHGSMQADMVLEEELRVLLLDLQVTKMNDVLGLA